jgi:hypothetical protein
MTKKTLLKNESRIENSIFSFLGVWADVVLVMRKLLVALCSEEVPTMIFGGRKENKELACRNWLHIYYYEISKVQAAFGLYGKRSEIVISKAYSNNMLPQ